MKSILHFAKVHGYGIFVTLLVCALGAAALLLRHQDHAAPSAAAAEPSPVPMSTPIATAETAAFYFRPVSGGILASYAPDMPVWNAAMDCWQTHAAVDLAAAQDEPVRAAADGVVQSVFHDPLLGLTVIIAHSGGGETRYAALSGASCKAGQAVRAGDTIGTAGNSADSESLLGCHLHFELLQDGLPVKPRFAP